MTIYTPAEAAPFTVEGLAQRWGCSRDIEMQVISRFLAHKDQRTTSSIYSKPRPAHLIGAAEVVNFRKPKG